MADRHRLEKHKNGHISRRVWSIGT